MKKIIKEIYFMFDCYINEMANNLFPKNTGLPMNIWISTKDRTKHGPRIKVQNNHSTNIQSNEFITITLEEKPRIIKKIWQKNISNDDYKLVVNFINKNRLLILDYWENKINDNNVLISRIKKV
jgi:hypothetical protein